MSHTPIINTAHDHQALKRFQEDRSILKIPQREFSDDTLMYAHLITLKQINQNRLSFPQMIDPDVRINEDSHVRSLLRGAASAAESLPPSAASCRPLSIRTRSSTASLIKADRSLTPVSSSARASRSSSSVTVVLMLTSTFRIASRASSFDSSIDAHSRSLALSPNGKAGPHPRATRPLPHSENTFKRHEQLPRSRTSHDCRHPHIIHFTQYSISNTIYTHTITTHIPTTASPLHICFT